MDIGTQENSADLGGLKIPPVSGADVSANGPSADSSAAAGVLQKRRGRPPGSTNNPSAKQPASGVPPISPQAFAMLYSPEMWGGIATAPANAMAFSTGKAYWRASEEEKKALGQSCSLAAQVFAVSDPRWLAAAAALITLANFYGMRIAQHVGDKKNEKQAEPKK